MWVASCHHVWFEPSLSLRYHREVQAMAISDHVTRVPTMRAVIHMVDPPNRILDVVGADGAARRISLTNIPPMFVWPRPGESWTIREQNGNWNLGERFQSDDDTFDITDLDPGEGLVPAAAIWTTDGSRLLTTDDGNLVVGPTPPSNTSALWIDTTDLTNDADARLDALEAKLLPDYDSGWLADSNHTTGPRTYTHNLGLLGPPREFQLWFSPDQVNWFPVGENRGMGTTTIVPNTQAVYHNPSMVQVTATLVIIGVYVDTPDTGMPLFSVYSGSGWANYATGYWRFRIWR
jgi:hypothetical protein